MNFKSKIRLMGILLIGIMASPSAMCMNGLEEGVDELLIASIASPELEMEEDTLLVPRYGVSEVSRIYHDLLEVDSDRRREYLKEILRQSDDEYSRLMAICPEDSLEVWRKSLFETLSFVSNNRTARGNNLLHYAAYNDRFDIFLDVKSCLRDRADAPKDDYYMMLDMQNVCGDTPLHCAVASGNVEFVKYILETIFMRKPGFLSEGRYVSEACFIRNNNGYTPIELARHLQNITTGGKKRETYARIVRLFESIPVIMNVVNTCDHRDYGCYKPRLSDSDISKLKQVLNPDNANLRISENMSLLGGRYIGKMEDCLVICKVWELTIKNVLILLDVVATQISFCIWMTHPKT